MFILSGKSEFNGCPFSAPSSEGAKESTIERDRKIIISTRKIRVGALSTHPVINYFTNAIVSTSTSTSLGSCFAATHERAGLLVKYSA